MRLFRLTSGPRRGKKPAAKPKGRLKVALEKAYARIEGEAVLQHEARGSMLRLIREEPGLSLQEIGARVRLARGPTQWHLDKLERNGYVSRVRHGGESLFFPRGTAPSQARSLAALRHPSRRALLDLAARQPGLRPSEASRALGLQPPTIRHHARELLELGLLEQRDEGGSVRYAPTQQGLELLTITRPLAA